ncbi:hypothetical protein A3A49_00070 [Candidatus Curtissbacteria bacterium RIFCSPLOWO2_01_FULL_38_11b]|uniref:DUF5615 domain-containing protein n=1 Tax=Candidatus Curtissbacteria bacterium RIFCSPLOWO2_01_FULL_38_11b TaxID=1797725 RepID=A0A1F5H291_9BACT|nr:MAG: hypothetical protein A3A49_00070 [Candidatus Curtissbacteria bacterium RIFCSPLOWO2_01_FULL_38_11b]
MRKPPLLKFLVDESVEYSIVEFLRLNKFDTLSISESQPSTPDEEVLALANHQKRILITNDKDFGELVFKEALSSNGVILIRMPFSKTEDKVTELEKALKSKASKLPRLFTTIKVKRTRFKNLPSA